MLTRVEWWSAIAGTVVSSVLSAGIVGLITWRVTRWYSRRQERRNAADWKLELIRNDEWSLTRLSVRPALQVGMRLTNEPNAPGYSNHDWNPEAGLDRLGFIFIDLGQGQSHRVLHAPHGISLTLTWIEQDTRLKAYVQTRAGKDEYLISLREAVRGW